MNPMKRQYQPVNDIKRIIQNPDIVVLETFEQYCDKLKRTLEKKNDLQLIISINPVKDIDLNTKTQIATLYARIFNDTWNENWTVDSALEELNTVLQQKDRELVLAYIKCNNDIIGFSWAQLINTANISENDMPFSLKADQKSEGVKIARYWFQEIGHTSKILLYRELAVLETFSQKRLSPYLTSPTLFYASTRQIKRLFLSTSLKSKVYRWSLFMGASPIHYFITNDLVLMQGKVKTFLDTSNAFYQDEKPIASYHLNTASIQRYN